jgi:PPM family protein phosphatase
MRPVAAGLTDVGRKRDHNEDRFVLLPEFGVFMVADGMGGHQCGEVASRMATATVAGFLRERRLAGRGEVGIPEILRCALVEANEHIYHRGMKSYGHRGMGTTVVAAAYARERSIMYVAHAGDSRCYRLRKSALSQITRDHSLVEEALRTRPDISATDLSFLPSNVITRALGVEPTVDIDLVEDHVELGDLYLLCTDGLHGFVSEERVGEILRTTQVLTEACSKLVSSANENGGGDNITVVLVRFEAVEDPWARATSVPPPPMGPPRG